MTAGTDPRIAIKRLLKEGGPEADVLMSFMEIQLAHHGTAFLRGLKISLANLPEEHALSEFVSSLETWTLDAQANAFADDGGVFMTRLDDTPVLDMPVLRSLPGFPIKIGGGRPRFIKTSDGTYLNLDRIERISPEEGSGARIYNDGFGFDLDAYEYETLRFLLDEEAIPLGPVDASATEDGGGL